VTTQSLYSTIITTINKSKTYCFGIDCIVLHSSSVQLGLQAWTWETWTWEQYEQNIGKAWVGPYLKLLAKEMQHIIFYAHVYCSCL